MHNNLEVQMENSENKNVLNTEAGIEKLESKFQAVQIPTDVEPTKIFNRIKFYALGANNGINYTPMGAKSIIAFRSGQQIELSIESTISQNPAVVAFENTLYVNGVNIVKVTGRENKPDSKDEYDNKILAENCKSCTIETGPVKNNFVNTVDLLVMKNCKLMRVISGQASNITGIVDTTADVTILPPEPAQT